MSNARITDADAAAAAATSDIADNLNDLLTNFPASSNPVQDFGTSMNNRAPILVPPPAHQFYCAAALVSGNVASDGNMNLNSKAVKSQCLNTTDFHHQSSNIGYFVHSNASSSLASSPSQPNSLANWLLPLEPASNSSYSTLMQQPVVSCRHPEVGAAASSSSFQEAAFPFPAAAQQQQLQQQDQLRDFNYLFANVGQLTKFDLSERQLRELMRAHSCSDIMEESAPSSPITLAPQDHVVRGQLITALPLPPVDVNDQRASTTTSFDNYQQQHQQQPISAFADDHVSRLQPTRGLDTPVSIPLSVSRMDASDDSSESVLHQQQNGDDNNAIVDTSQRSRAGSSRSRPGSRGRRSRSEGDRGDLLLYRFCCDLLRDPTAYQDIIHWEDERQGVFRIAHAKNVAFLWGLKKDKTNMTYDKMSRSFRYCRDVGYFDEIPRFGVYRSTRLLFKFGEKATNWRSLSSL